MCSGTPLGPSELPVPEGRVVERENVPRGACRGRRRWVGTGVFEVGNDAAASVGAGLRAEYDAGLGYRVGGAVAPLGAPQRPVADLAVRALVTVETRVKFVVVRALGRGRLLAEPALIGLGVK